MPDFKKYLGSGDIFFRLSGDEFIVVFTEHSLQNVKEILQKVLIELKIQHKNALPYEPSFTYGLLEVQSTSNYSLTDILNRVDEKCMSRNVLTIYLNASRTLACKNSLTRLKKQFFLSGRISLRCFS